MGEKSQPAEEAISWSTDPVCALWFANRSARGTRLVSARVDPEQIAVYNPGYRAEHEVILKPGIKLIVQEEDMIPSTEAIVPKLLAPVTKDFFDSAPLLRLWVIRRSICFSTMASNTSCGY